MPTLLDLLGEESIDLKMKLGGELSYVLVKRIKQVTCKFIKKK